MSAIDFATIDELAPDIGEIDVPCPICGPERRKLTNRRRKVMRIWRLEPGTSLRTVRRARTCPRRLLKAAD